MKSLSKQYREPLKCAGGLQFIALLLSSLILDGGGIARLVFVAVLAYWVGLIIMLLRRPDNPTKADIALGKWGFLLLLLATFGIAYFVHGAGIR